MLSILCVAVACKDFEEMGLHLQLHTESRYKLKVTKQITDHTHTQTCRHTDTQTLVWLVLSNLWCTVYL